jgi:arsenite methyltransferase
MVSKLTLWFYNRAAASARNKPDQVVAHLRLRPGDVVADIGSGGGFYTLAFAQQVGEGGKVYAVDIKARFLDYIEDQARRRGIRNVETVLISGDTLGLPDEGVDLFFARDVFHHLPEPDEFFRELKPFLKPTGRVAIIDYFEPQGITFIRLFGHFSSPDAILSNLEEAGYTLAESFSFPPAQSFNVFTAR